MKYEDLIEEKHLFEDRTAQFLDLISRMENRELELALGRLLDFLADAKSDYQKAQIKLRGEIIQSYFSLRKTGAKSRRFGVGVLRKPVPPDLYWSFPRRKFFEDPYDYQMRCATEAELITEAAFGSINQIVDKPIPEQVRLLAP